MLKVVTINPQQEHTEPIERLEKRIEEKMLFLREIFGKPVDPYTGNFVELNAEREASRLAIYSPSTGDMDIELLLCGSEFKQLFRDIQQLFIVCNSASQPNRPIKALKEIITNIRWATLNAYSLPVTEKLDEAKRDLRELRYLLEQRNQFEGQLNMQVKQLMTSIQKNEKENARMRNEIEGVEEMMPRIAQRTRSLEVENQRMCEEIARRRAQSPERRAQLEAQAAEIAELKRNLAAARDAFASCRFTNNK